MMLSSLDTSNAALAGRYDEIPYEALPHPATHPDRLASVASFFDHVPPVLDHCRVLEVGCNDGGNLIPMAVSLPNGHYVGCDLSPRAIAAGRQSIDALRLTNITLVEQDFAALAPEYGPFDFIIAHGVYSWVPMEVRDALFAFAGRRLAPNGILYASFNVLPGCRVRQAAWDVLHHHVDHIESPRARLDSARHLARLVAAGGAPTYESDKAVRAEFAAIAQRSDSELYHDDLAVPNEPVFFQTFADHAARHHLRYLADAEFQTVSATGASDEAKAYVSTLAPLAREQYLDFIRLRRFRQALLVRDDARVDTRPRAERVRAMHVSANWSLADIPANKLAQIARGLDPTGGGGGAVRTLLDALVAQQPASCEIASLEDRLTLRSLPRPIEAILGDAYMKGIVDLHVQPLALTSRPSDRPRASPLARLQARTRNDVSTLLHMQVGIADQNALRLLPLVDGTRDHSALAAAVRSYAVDLDPARAPHFVEFAVKKFARLGLLMADAIGESNGRI